jgi:hypothetical protein
MKNVLPVLFVMLWGADSAVAYSVGCGLDSSQVDNSSDESIMALWGCDSATLGNVWSNMNAGDWGKRWDGDFGLKDACNTRRVTGRFLNAGWLIGYSSTYSKNSCSDCGGSLLAEGWSQIHLIKRPWPSCTNDGAGATTHLPMGYSILGTDNLELKPSFVAYGDIIWRAGTLVHEARHWAKKHDAGNKCPRGGSCDSSWGYNGADTYETLWLWWFYARAGFATSFLRKAAGRSAQGVADSAFRQPTGLSIY